MHRENCGLVTIVAADIAGYSRLIGQDEEGPLRVLRAHRKEQIDRLIDAHGGRIANTAADRVAAGALAKTFSHLALHFPIPEWRGLITGLAYPFPPAELDKGEVYKFNINPVLYPDDPCEMFRYETMEVGWHDLSRRLGQADPRINAGPF